MPKCDKCKEFGSKKEMTKCKGTCDTFYHKKCAAEAGLSDVGTCTQCVKGISSPKTFDSKLKVDLQKTTPAELLSQVNAKLEILFSMKKTLDALNESVDFYAEKYEEIKVNLVKADARIKHLENMNTYHEKHSKALEERIMFLEAKSREKNIEIAGLQAKAGEDLKKTVENVAIKLGVNSSTISEVMGVGIEKTGKEAGRRPRPVIVTLTSISARNEWLSQKKKRLTNSDIYGNNDSMPIYFNEDLTKFTRELLWQAKNELKSNFKFVWVQHGKILARKDEKEENKRIYVIRSADDVQRLKKMG
ncbi:hypothetical protein NE865_08999 [Phthorimaea operculella]|nr:hypothetical protein NE865_08999 [Phthorimaea operculella]